MPGSPTEDIPASPNCTKLRRFSPSQYRGVVPAWMRSMSCSRRYFVRLISTFLDPTGFYSRSMGAVNLEGRRDGPGGHRLTAPNNGPRYAETWNDGRLQ